MVVDKGMMGFGVVGMDRLDYAVAGMDKPGFEVVGLGRVVVLDKIVLWKKRNDEMNNL